MKVDSSEELKGQETLEGPQYRKTTQVQLCHKNSLGHHACCVLEMSPY